MGARGRATRAALQRAALDLFEGQGYDGTTVEQIAAAAGVTPMTFFRHFPTKSSAVMDDPYDPLIGSIVAQQPVSLPALQRASQGLAAAWTLLPAPDRDDSWRRVRILAQNPALQAHMWESLHQTQSAIAEVLVVDGTSRREAQVAAGACLGALVAAFMEWGRSGEDDLGEIIASALGQLCPTSTPPAPAP